METTEYQQGMQRPVVNSAGQYITSRDGLLDCMMGFLQELSVGVVITDGALNVLYVNTAANHSIKQNRTLSIELNRLKANSFFGRKTLLDAVKKTRAGQSCRINNMPVPFSILDDVSRQQQYLTVSLMRRNENDYLVFLIGELKKDKLKLEHYLRDYFQLTPCETAVAKSLAAGKDVLSIARSLRISVNTVKSHKRQIYAKTRVSSQVEFVQLLFSTPAMIWRDTTL